MYTKVYLITVVKFDFYFLFLFGIVCALYGFNIVGRSQKSSHIPYKHNPHFSTLKRALEPNLDLAYMRSFETVQH